MYVKEQSINQNVMLNTSNSITRKEWIDALRAIAILLVVLGHQVQWWDDFFTYTSAIKVPLFFAISGYLFKLRNFDFLVFFVNLFKKLIFPYICLALISSVIALPISGFDNFRNSIFNIFSGKSYWFLPCLIIGEIIFFFLVNYLKSKLLLILGCSTFFILGYILKQYEILSFGMINIAFEIQLFMLIGFLFRKEENFLTKINLITIILMGLLYIVLCYLSKVFFYDSTIDLDIHLSKYYNLPYCIFLILLGNLVLFTIGMKLVYAPRLLTYIGQNTLVIYMWAGWGILFPKYLMKLIELPIFEQSFFYAFTKFISAIVFCCICSFFLNRYFPFIVGKSNNK